MSAATHTVKRTPMRAAPGRAGAPWSACLGGHADGGFGLVVVDQGNPRRHRISANVPFAVAF